MSQELAIVGQSNTALAPAGGLGIDFSSKLFQLKPATLNINQPNTQVEGAIKGKLRINETGDQFDELTCTLLVMPVEQRSYYTGQAGQLNRTQDNLMCFSRDMVRPDEKAKVPQSMLCKNCPKASWDKWRQTKLKEDIPGCDAYYYALLIDTVYQMPLQMFIRSKAKQPFEQGCNNIARKLMMMKAQGGNPNIFDIAFKLKTKSIKTGALTSYVPDLSDFRSITPAEREAFGEIYKSFISRGQKADDDIEQSSEQQIDDASQAINNVVADSDIQDGEIVI